MKVGLGTVQFGLDYGISNREGRTPEAEVRDILALARQKGITLLDTASAYGNSEAVIGQNLPAGPAFDLVTKTPLFHKERIDPGDAMKLEETFRQSLARLRQTSLYGLLIHHAPDLLVPGGASLWETMERLKERGLVRKIGVSVYSPLEIEAITARYKPDLIQLPVNVFDQRMIRAGHLRHLKEMGIEVHSRSVFLQGLLLMPPEELMSHFDPIRPKIAQYHAELRQQGISPLSSALGFVYHQSDIDSIIVGINTRAHLKEIWDVITNITPSSHIDYSLYAMNEEAMINPSQWRLQ